jgi:hypothetical protein
MYFPATGGTIIDVSGYRYHVFRVTGSLVVSTEITVETLIVGGGGQGGTWCGGGGGGGGVVHEASHVIDAGTHTVTVGNGSSRATADGPGVAGGDSVFHGTTAYGGGGGGAYPTETGGNGANGGGAAHGSSANGGTGSQGYNGGKGSANDSSGGGGGAGEQGHDAVTVTGGIGGIGVQYADFAVVGVGSPAGWFGGGGGGFGITNKGTADPYGGGGIGSNQTGAHGGNGVANSGGGGGGGWYHASASDGGGGGTGLVVLRYPIAAYTPGLRQVFPQRLLWDKAYATGLFAGVQSGSVDPAYGETYATHPWVVTGIFRNLSLKRNTELGAGITFTLTLRVNGVDTLLSTVVDDTTTVSADTTHGIPVFAGDVVTLKRVRSTGAGYSVTEDVSCAIEFESADDVTSGYGGNGPYGPLSATSYNEVFNFYAENWGNNSSVPSYAVVAVAGTLTRYDMRLDTAPGTGKSRAFHLVLNGVVQDGGGGTTDTGLTISDTATTGSWTGSLAIAEGDTVQVKHEASGSPANSSASIGVAFQATTALQSNYALPRGSPNAGATRYGGSFCNPWNGTEATSEILAGQTDFSLHRMRVQIASAASHAFTARVNQATPADSLVATLAAGTTASDLTHVVTVEADDTFDTMFTPSGGTYAVGVACVMMIPPYEPSAGPSYVFPALTLAP